MAEGGVQKLPGYPDCHSRIAPWDWGQAIAAVAQHIHQSRDLPTIWQTILASMQRLLDCDRALVYQFLPDMTGRVVAEAVRDPQWSILDQLVQDTCFEADWLKGYDDQRVWAVSDVAQAKLTPCHAEFLATFQVKANLAIPVRCESRLWGLLIAHDCTAPRPWPQGDMAGLQQMALYGGIAVQQASLAAQLYQAKADLNTHAQAERGLNRDERLRLAAIVESSQEAILSKTLAGIITSWNPAAERLYGYTAQEIIGQSVNRLIPVDLRTEEAQITQALAQGQRVDPYETQRQHKDGRILNVAMTLSPILDGEGRVVGTSTIARDITAQRQNQQTLQEQTAILESFYASSPLMMGVVELSQNDILHLSDNLATATFFNTTVEALAGQWASNLGTPLEHIQLWINYYCQSQNSGHPVRFDYAHTKDEKTIWLSVVVSFIGIGNYQRPRFSYVAEDISDRKQMELALQAKNQELNQFFTTALDLLCIADTEGYFRRLSQQWQETLGYSLHQLEGSRFLDYVHPEDLPTTLEAIRRLGNQQTVLHFTNRYRCQDGSYRWLEWRSIPIGDLIYATARDITDRRQVELDLKVAKEQIDLVLQASSEGFSDWDLMANEIYFSPQFKAMLGYTDHEFENSLDMWNSVILKEDRETYWQLLKEYNHGKVEQFSVTQRYHHKNGSIIHVLTRAIHLKNAQGQVIRIVGSYLDITSLVTTQEALKTSETQLGSVLNSSLDGIMAFRSVRDLQDKIIDFEWLLSNPTACNMVGHSEEYLIGKRLLEDMPGNRAEGLFDGYVHTVETGEPYQREFYYNHDGVESWFETVAVKLEDGFAVTFRNVTALKQSEQALFQLNAELENRVADLAQRHAEMVILNEISDFLQAAATVEEACCIITNLVEDLFPHCAGGIFITRESRNRLENINTFGPAVLPSQVVFNPHHCWALRRGQVHHVEADRASLRCQHIPDDTTLATTLCVPMIAQGETLGLLYLATENPAALDDLKQQLARTLAEQVGMAIANLKLKETLKHQSIRDPLTGLYNRRYLEETLTQEIVRAERKQHSIGVIMLDIDHFKRLNDTFGHDIGDFVLQLVAKLLRENVRKSDIVCRYGGEEMTIILPEATLAETEAHAEALRHALTQINPHHQGQSLGMLTASFGVAAFPNHGNTPETLIKAADTVLYQAKAAGRNQVLTAS